MRNTIQRWGDDDTDDDDDTNVPSKQVDETQNDHVKTTLQAVARRKEWKTFGQAATDEMNGVQTTFIANQEVFLDPPGHAASYPEDPIWGTKLSTMVKSLKEGRRRRALTLQHGLAPPSGGAHQVDVSSSASSNYVPPHVRRRLLEQQRGCDDGTTSHGVVATTTICVTNLSPATTEADLHELVSHYGRVSRVNLARKPDTSASRGFGFVTFANQADATSAMEALQGYGYDHMILKLQWAAARPY